MRAGQRVFPLFRFFFEEVPFFHWPETRFPGGGQKVLPPKSIEVFHTCTGTHNRGSRGGSLYGQEEAAPGEVFRRQSGQGQRQGAGRPTPAGTSNRRLEARPEAQAQTPPNLAAALEQRNEGRMTRATGVGGVFLRAADPEKLQAWYEEYLGIKRTEDGAFAFFSEGPR